MLVIVAAGLDFLILKDKYQKPQTVQNFSVSKFRSALVQSDSREVKVVSASSTGYYRVSSGSASIEGKYVTGSIFQSTDTLSVGLWVAKSDGEVSITVMSETPVEVTLISTTSNYAATIFVSLFILLVLFLLFIMSTI
jgi:hypothetical protein